MHGARSGVERGKGGGPRGLPLEIRESRANIAAAMNTIPLPVIAHATRNTPLATKPSCAVRPSTALAFSPWPFRPPPAAHPRRVVVRDPRLTRARPLFSTRWSFVDAFPVCHSVCHSIAVVCRPPPRVADAVIVEPRIAADKTLAGKEGWDRSMSARESRDDDRDDDTSIMLSLAFTMCSVETSI